MHLTYVKSTLYTFVLVLITIHPVDERQAGEAARLEHCHTARKGGAGVLSIALKHEAIYKL
jgi:hypothetical protein